MLQLWRNITPDVFFHKPSAMFLLLVYLLSFFIGPGKLKLLLFVIVLAVVLFASLFAFFFLFFKSFYFFDFLPSLSHRIGRQCFRTSVETLSCLRHKIAGSRPACWCVVSPSLVI